MALSSGSHTYQPTTAIAIDTTSEKLVLVPTTRFASCWRRAPRYCPMRMVAAMDAPKRAPSSRNRTMFALELAVSAASPR